VLENEGSEAAFLERGTFLLQNEITPAVVDPVVFLIFFLAVADKFFPFEDCGGSGEYSFLDEGGECGEGGDGSVVGPGVGVRDGDGEVEDRVWV